MKLVRSVLCWLSLLIFGSLGLLLMLLTPKLQWRRSIARFVACVVLRAGGLRLQILGWANLPAGSSVLVANHTSYLDGVILTAALPPRFAFVIKSEMQRVPLAGALLHRIGSEFVDRFNRHRGASDARRVLRRAREGQSLVFFPEGTFSKELGLMKFHTGAFVTALRAGSAVTPLVIRGARRALPYNRAIVTPGVIEIEILQPIVAGADDKDAALALRDKARAAILERLGEPDLERNTRSAQESDTNKKALDEDIEVSTRQ